jgi:hypothetical protein
MYERNYAAGILPITWNDGIPLFLVGKDVRDGSFSDFGGKSERYDRNDIISTACREFYEETLGAVLSIKQIRARLNPGTSIMLHGKTQNANAYYMYVTEVPYLPHLRNTFHKILEFLRSKNVQRLYVEKTDVQWVTLGMLKHIMKRKVFANTLDLNSEAIETIGNCTPDLWKDICERHASNFGRLLEPFSSMQAEQQP